MFPKNQVNPQIPWFFSCRKPLLEILVSKVLVESSSYSLEILCCDVRGESSACLGQHTLRCVTAPRAESLGSQPGVKPPGQTCVRKLRLVSVEGAAFGDYSCFVSAKLLKWLLLGGHHLALFLSLTYTGGPGGWHVCCLGVQCPWEAHWPWFRKSKPALFPEVTVRALASDSQVSLSSVLHFCEMWASLTSGVGNPHTYEDGCSCWLKTQRPEALAFGCLRPSEVPGAPVALGPGRRCMNVYGWGCTRAEAELPECLEGSSLPQQGVGNATRWLGEKEAISQGMRVPAEHGGKEGEAALELN